MEILIWIDQEDKDNMNNLINVCQVDVHTCQQKKDEFWHGLIDKYPYLKNRRIAINLADGYIFQLDSMNDLKHIRLGRTDVLHP